MSIEFEAQAKSVHVESTNEADNQVSDNLGDDALIEGGIQPGQFGPGQAVQGQSVQEEADHRDGWYHVEADHIGHLVQAVDKGSCFAATGAVCTVLHVFVLFKADVSNLLKNIYIL